MKKLFYIIFPFLISESYAQGSDVLIQNGIEITKSTYGLGHDDQNLVDFFKKNKKPFIFVVRNPVERSASA